MIKNLRLPAPFGTLINRDKTISFHFEGQSLQGFEGDTIVSALLANNISVLSRSFKYHRPRGSMTSLGHDANTLVQLPDHANALGDVIKLKPGMQVTGQNYVGSLKSDRMAMLGLVSRFLPVAFYYKAFFRPKNVWEKWAPLFRKVAGLGVLNTETPFGYFDKQYHHFDVTVIGGGAAGMSAALASAAQGARVLLVEEQPVLGGSLNYCRFDVEGEVAGNTRQELISQIEAADNITVMTNSVCNGWFTDNWLPVISGNRMHKVRTEKLIVSTGVIEQPVVFRNNDLPGIMTVTAAQRFMRLYAIQPGKEAVLLAGDDNAYALALDLMEAGVKVKAIVDLREQAAENELAAKVRAQHIEVFTHSTVFSAKADSKTGHLSQVEIRRITGRGECGNQSTQISCDLLCMSGGYVPTYQLLCQGGATLSYDEKMSAFAINNLASNVAICGALNGCWDLQDVIDDGARAGAQAVKPASDSTQYDDPIRMGIPNVPWPIFAHPKGKEFVDFDEDLQIADIVNSVADGYAHIQLVKRYSTVGMGPSQGRHSALNTARLVAAETQRSVAQTGVTTARPPFSPEFVGHLAGRTGFVTRKTPLHDEHVALNASMDIAGKWLRPRCYGENSDTIIENEMKHVYQHVGICDVTMQGGIDVVGQQALTLLESVFAATFSTLAVGESRYALQVNKLYAVTGDAVVHRLGEQHFYVTTSQARADSLAMELEKTQVLGQLKAVVRNVASAWTKLVIAGPRSSALLAGVFGVANTNRMAGAELANGEVEAGGITCRLFKINCIAEPAFELHVPQHHAVAVWQYLLNQPEVKPLGNEALRRLKIEHGDIAIGQDSDPESTPDSLGLQWAVDPTKPALQNTRHMLGDYISELDKQLVQFKAPASLASQIKENLLVVDQQRLVGRVTSCCYSPRLKCVTGMAIIYAKQAPQSLTIKSESGQLLSAEVQLLTSPSTPQITEECVA
ncbi:2Fe-2S iron-sulfur cluster-binding protein [Alteromonas lipolytica]|uniref:Aminomethyltransferase n=1 Tax=Alteromonas lipolytica TaxID=1856405 RepID=A0A1E8FBJ7_9ALTE|nr:2Fe-2S iron-sulfur cluster-binding protein [Alteromonas lipolytica]OFI33285.1 hypothetical protein BFC17_03220 [Alteromonas lipolytica]GGF61020.1 aminomethyltransferase [Alteromonas lipolytica]